jgi:hypothetical protein
LNRFYLSVPFIRTRVFLFLDIVLQYDKNAAAIFVSFVPANNKSSYGLTKKLLAKQKIILAFQSKLIISFQKECSIPYKEKG